MAFQGNKLGSFKKGNRKVAKPWFNSRCGSALLCPWERHLMLSPILGPSNLPVVVGWWSIVTKAMQTEQLLCWSGMTDTEHTTSDSNEEKEDYIHISSTA